MQISAINQSQNFKGIKKTEKGNEYETYNGGKLGGTLLVALDIFTDADFDKTSMNKTFKEMILFSALGFAVGTIFDNQVNKVRAKDADTYAETGKVNEKTNSGVQTGLKLGALAGAITSIITYAIYTKNKKSLTTWKKALPFIMVPCMAILPVSFGWSYDSGVNKFRAKLEQKSKAQKIKINKNAQN